MARALHLEYVRSREAAGTVAGSEASVVPWELLPDDLRASNRDAALHVRDKLRAVGCHLARLEDWNADLFRFTDAEVDLLAAMEHERWVAERQAWGWKYAPVKTVERKTSPYLLPLVEMTDAMRAEVRMYDAASVRALPRVLASVGLQIVRPGGDSARQD